MDNEDFYELSTKVNQVLLSAKSLLGLNILRFRHLVDNSPKGFDCTYAMMTRRHFLEARAQEKSTLLALRDNLNEILEAIDEIEDNQ